MDPLKKKEKRPRLTEDELSIIDEGLILLLRDLYKKREDLTKTGAVLRLLLKSAYKRRGRPSKKKFSWDQIGHHLERYYGTNDE